jgi:hypothetical protein
MAILLALRWRKWGCGRPYRQAFFVPEQLCRNAAPAQPFFVPRHTFSICGTKKRAGTLFRVLIRTALTTNSGLQKFCTTSLVYWWVRYLTLSYPRIVPRWAWGTSSTHPCLLVESERKPTFQHDIYRTYLST